MYKDYWISGYETLNFTPEAILSKVIDYKADNLIVNYSFEWQPYPNFKDLYDLCIQKGIKLTCILGGTGEFELTAISKEYPKIEIVFWPTYWIYFATSCQQSQGYLLEQRPREIKNLEHQFLCMGGQPHLHRCIIIDEIWKRNLQKFGKLSWHLGGINYRLPHDWKFKYFPEQKILLEDGWTLGSGSAFKLPIEFDKSSLIFVTESQWNTVFVTEKTVMASLRRKPWIMIGGVGQNQFMKQIGFMLMEDIIDYSFDKIEDVTERSIKAVDQLEKWINLENWDQIEKTPYIQDILYHNHKNVYDIMEKRILFPDLINDLLDRNDTRFEETKFINKIKEFKFNQILHQ